MQHQRPEIILPFSRATSRVVLSNRSLFGRVILNQRTWAFRQGWGWCRESLLRICSESKLCVNACRKRKNFYAISHLSKVMLNSFCPMPGVSCRSTNAKGHHHSYINFAPPQLIAKCLIAQIVVCNRSFIIGIYGTPLSMTQRPEQC